MQITNYKIYFYEKLLPSIKIGIIFSIVILRKSVWPSLVIMGVIRSIWVVICMSIKTIRVFTWLIVVIRIHNLTVFNAKSNNQSNYYDKQYNNLVLKVHWIHNHYWARKMTNFIICSALLIHMSHLRALLRFYDVKCYTIIRKKAKGTPIYII